jgi:hypothetical protein
MSNTAPVADIPPYASFPLTALVLIISMAHDRVPDRWAAGLKKMRELVAQNNSVASSLMRYTLTSAEQRGPFSLLPSEQPSLEELLAHMDTAHKDLRLAAETGTLAPQAIIDFLENSRQIALAAVFIDLDAEATPEQTEVLNYLYQVAQGHA